MCTATATRLLRVLFVSIASLSTMLLVTAPVLADIPCWECWGPGLPDPCRNALYSVAVVPGSGGNDVWAVGAKGSILHWDGSVWSKVVSPTTERLRSIAMARTNLGLAVGYNGKAVKWNGTSWSTSTVNTDEWFRTVAFTPGTNGTDAWAAPDKVGVGRFCHWNGSSWETKVGGKYHLFGGIVWGLSMLTVNDGWAVGERFQGTGMIGQILQWNGSSWTQVASPETKLYAIDMFSATNGWAVGEGGTLVAWNGSDWTVSPDSPTEEDLWAVDLLTASDGWAVGDSGAILHWNGSVWSAATSPVSQALRGVAIASANDAWAVGVGGTILHWDGSRWNAVLAPTTNRLEGVAITPGSGGRDAWMVGAAREPLHWDGHTWTPVQGATSGYYSVGMVSPNDGWAMGWGGRFCHWDGHTWTEMGRWESAKDVAMLANNNGWAVGWGKIQHWNGSTWSMVTSPSTRTYYGMDAVGPDDIWAVGDVGTIAHYDGNNWSSVTSPVSEWLVDVSMASASDGWIVGNYGVCLHWNGTRWSQVDNDLIYSTLRGVSVIPSNDGTLGWAVGHGGEVYWLQDGTWSAGCSPTANDLGAVVMVSRYEAWAVGDKGVIMHWVETNRPDQTEHVYLPLLER